MLMLLSTLTFSQKLKDFDSGKYNPEKFMFANKFVFYEGDTIARLMSVELAYDDGKIVSEATFRLHTPNSYDAAIALIKAMHALKPNWEIEVQIDY